MSDDRPLELFEHGEDLGPEFPLLYLAMPLSHLETDDQRQHVDLLAHTVGRAIADATRGAAEPWPVRVHSPIKWSAPWRTAEEWTPEGVYELNTGQLWEAADGLIIIGYRGGSLGSGQELAWACARHLPVLYVYPHTAQVSRQLEGAGQEHDITLKPYASPEDLTDLVGRWLASRRHIIADGPRRRRAGTLRFSNLQARLSHAWQGCSATQREHVVATTRMALGRIERLLSSPLVLGAASAHELAALGDALGLDAVGGLFARPLPDLRSQQTAALRNAAAEYGWDVSTAFDLYTKARLELARGGVRRLPLSSIQDWVNFHRRHHGL